MPNRMAAAVVAESLKIVCAVPSVMIQPASTSLPSDGPCTDCGAIYIPLPSYDDITKVHLPPNKVIIMYPSIANNLDVNNSIYIYIYI